MSNKVNSWRLGILIVLFFGGVLCQFQDGDTCKTKSGKDGTCKFISNCPAALDDLKRGILSTDICGYKGTQSIICCVERPIFSNVRPAPGARAAAMCKEYAQFAYEEDYSKPFSSNSNEEKILRCHMDILGKGTLAGRKEFPHMIHIGYKDGNETKWGCGGSLISPTMVLTAAHCMMSLAYGEPQLARGGITNQNDIIHLQIRNIVERYAHPNFTTRLRYHDIALVRLNEHFDLNTYLRPACLYTQKSIPYITAVASGWGKTHFAAKEITEDLLKVTLESYSTANCNKTYRRLINRTRRGLPMGIVEDLMLCYGSSEGQKDTCQGDAGGPLQVVHPETINTKCMYDIIGIISFGIACGIENDIPGVYTRVSGYIEWIENIVWPI